MARRGPLQARSPRAPPRQRMACQPGFRRSSRLLKKFVGSGRLPETKDAVLYAEAPAGQGPVGGFRPNCSGSRPAVRPHGPILAMSFPAASCGAGMG
jgi:hypothetical protein